MAPDSYISMFDILCNFVHSSFYLVDAPVLLEFFDYDQHCFCNMPFKMYTS